jgi:hypothetical protein
MSVTLFVEVEGKRTWRKWKSQVVAEAVGMWEARVLCELPKQCWKRGKEFLLFLSSNTAVISIAVYCSLSVIGCSTSLWLSNRAKGKVAKQTSQ